QEDGDIHVYLGTSAWVAAVSKTADKFKHGAAAIQSADPQCNLIAGITESAGANIEWIRDQFFQEEKKEYGKGIFDYMDKVIQRVPAGSDDLICTPWMLGERCPVSSTTTRATLFNVGMQHTREHLMRAVYEGIAYNIRWILHNFSQDYGFNTDKFRIIGGGALDAGWMQILADVTGSEISVVRDPRSAGAVGVAAIALIGLGVLPDFAATKQFAKVECIYTPHIENRKVYDELYRQYRQIYKALDKVYKGANGARFTGEK
ncbi:MAG: FGGY-family carbohydrate kinase, partial [Oscillospiraceae bacterium]